jgi:hypothetical protein
MTATSKHLTVPCSRCGKNVPIEKVFIYTDGNLCLWHMIEEKNWAIVLKAKLFCLPPLL